MKKEIEVPNTPRPVLVWVNGSGWLMGNYEDRIWRLFYSDVGMHVADDEDEILFWQELPKKPLIIP